MRNWSKHKQIIGAHCSFCLFFVLFLVAPKVLLFIWMPLKNLFISSHFHRNIFSVKIQPKMNVLCQYLFWNEWIIYFLPKRKYALLRSFLRLWGLKITWTLLSVSSVNARKPSKLKAYTLGPIKVYFNQCSESFQTSKKIK